MKIQVGEIYKTLYDTHAIIQGKDFYSPATGNFFSYILIPQNSVGMLLEATYCDDMWNIVLLFDGGLIDERKMPIPKRHIRKI